MTVRVVVAIVLIALGVAGLAYGGFSFTHKENVIDLGSVEVTRNERETLPVPPIVGGILVVCGVGLLVIRPSHT